MSDFAVAHAAGVELGERPVWDERAGVLAWADVTGGALQRLGAGGPLPPLPVGAPLGAAALRRDGGYVVARAGGVAFLDADGRPDRDEIPFALPPDVRFNDGACDPAGRFLVGTCSTAGLPGRGALYRLDPDGRVATLLDGIGESNGLAWSPDGTRLYYVDSFEPAIRCYAYEVETGALRRERDLAAIAGGAVPDGLVVDAQGAVWAALWEGGAVHRYAPDGSLLAAFPTPVSRPTCPALGGPRLDRLYVTTAWEGMTPAERAGEPLAGHVLVADAGVRGLPALRFAG